MARGNVVGYRGGTNMKTNNAKNRHAAEWCLEENA